MHVDIDPIILDKLHAFGARRRRLILIRGVCEVIACLLAVMCVIALVDWLLVLPDAVRWALSIGGYAIVGVFVWRTCLRLIMHSPDDRQLAMLLESVDPRWHEELLSAIELGQTDADFDSPLFRQMVQVDVAGKIRDLNVEAVLPSGVVRRWAFFAAFILIVCVGLALTPGLHFGQLLARALAPGANIARVSGVQVAIVEPAPAEPTVPQAEPLPIAVELTGPEVRDNVTLELFHPDGKRERVVMGHERDRRFATTVSVGSDSLEYRVLAGDAVTKRYTITARPRPYITAFEKTVKMPAYTERDASTVSENHGDIDALQGSTVDLVLSPDQPIENAELRFEYADTEQSVPLEATADGKLRATVPVNKSGLYKVHLVAKETGFTNAFSPKYEIAAQPDTVPRVAIIDPTESMTLPADQILSLRGEAEDDLGLRSVEQVIRVNDRRPVSVPLADKPGTLAELTRQWDLLGLELKPGDTVTTRLVAVDLAGHRAESNPLTIAIAAGGVDAESLAALKAEQKFADELRRFSSVANIQKRRAEDTAEQLQGAAADDPQADLYASNLTEAITAFTDAADRASLVGGVALRQSSGVADGHDLTLAMRGIAEARHRTAHTAAFHLSNALEATDPEQRKRELDQVRSAFRKGDEVARRLVGEYDGVLGAHELAAAIEQMQAIVAEQQRINDPVSLGVADGEARRTLIKRRQSVAAAQVEAVERLLRTAGDRTDNSREKRLDGVAKHLEHHRGELRKVLDAEDVKPEDLTRASERFAHEVTGAYRSLRPLHHEMDKQAVKDRGQLLDLANHDSDQLFKTESTASTLSRALKYAAEAREKNDAGKVAEMEGKATDAATETLRLNLPMAADMLRARAAIEEGRPGGDARLVADTGMTVRALTLLRDRFAQDGDAAALAADLEKLAPAFRVVETVGQVRELSRSNLVLEQLETFETDRPAARTRRPRQWDFEQESFKPVSDRLDKAKLSEEARKILRELEAKPYARSLQTEFESRRLRDDANKPTLTDIAAVQTDLDKALELLEPEADAARQSIAEIAPTLAEAMRRAAETARKAEETSQKLAEHDRNPDSDRPTPEDLAALNQQQQQVNEQTSDVLDALRHEANLQNPLDREQLAKARDADDAAAMIKEPADRADAAVERALDVPPRPDRPDRLEEAAQQQEELAQTLEQVADHFEKLENGEDVTESRQALRDAEADLGVRSELDQQFAQAERLADLAQQDPKSLLEELERELPKNRAMQRELDDIGEQTADQAQQQLADAADAEQKVAEQLDESQKRADDQNRPMNDRVADLGRQARQLAQNEVPQATQKAQEADAQAAAEQTQKAGEQIADAAQQADPTVGDEAQQIAEAAEQAAKQIQQAAQKIEQSAGKTEQAAQQAAENAQNDGQKARANAAQQQAAQAQDEAKQAAQKANDAAQKAQQAAAEAQKASQQQAAAEQQAQQAQQQAAAAESGSPQQQQAQQQANAAQQQAQQANQQAQQAKQQAEQAARDLAQAARDTQTAAHRAAEAAKQADQASDSPAVDQLADAAQDDASDAKADAQRAQQTAEKGQTPSGRDIAQRAQDLAKPLNEAAEELRQAANAAQAAANETAAESAQESGKQAESAAEQAAQAAEAAQQAAQSAQKAAESAQQAAANQPDQGAKQAADQAAQKAQSAAQKAQQASEQAANAKQSAQDAQAKAAEAQKTATAAESGSPQQQQAAQQANQAQEQAKQSAQQAQNASQQAAQAAAEAQQAAQMAQQAGQQAAQSAQAKAGESDDAKQAAEQAQAAAKSTEQAAGESAQAAEQSGKSAEQAGQTAQQAQQTAQAGQQAANQARGKADQAANQANAAANRAEQIAKQAEQIAQQAGNAAEQQGSALAQAAEAQQQIGETVQDAAIDLGRAARHAERLGQMENAHQLGEAAAGTEAAAEQVGQAQEQLANADAARDAVGEVAEARDAIRAQAEALAHADIAQQQAASQGSTESAQPGAPGSEQPASPAGEQGQTADAGQSQSGQAQQGQSQSGQSPSGQSQSGQAQASGQPQQGQPAGQGPSPLDSPETGKWLARALDAADQQVYGPQQGEGQGTPQAGEATQANAEGQPAQGQPAAGQSPSQSAMSAALAQAAAAQAQAMAQARAQATASQPSQQPGAPISQGLALQSLGGAAADAANGGNADTLPDGDRLSDEDWGRLPPKLAKDLLEARRNAVSGEYRHMVDTYFKTIAEKARDKDK